MAASATPARQITHRREAQGRSLTQRLRLAGLDLAGACYAQAGQRQVDHPSDAAAPSILLIRPDHLGDLLFLTPALHALRAALPSARLTLLAGPWGAEAVRGNPDLDDLQLCPFPGFERRPKGNTLAPYRHLWQAAAEIASGGFDAAVILRFDHWWGAWLAAAAGIPARIGYDWPETRPFLTQAMPYRPEQHEVEQNAGLLSALAPDAGWQLGPLRYHVPAADQAWAESWLARQSYDPARPLIAIHPGAGAAVKQWPPACWASVADRLVQHCQALIILTGGPGERQLTGAVANAMQAPASDAAGQTTLGQLAALQARCALVLGVDSGPLHLAVAAGAPTLHLYGPVATRTFGPWGDPGRQRVIATPWACAPCNRLDWPAGQLALHGCMAAMQPEQVIAAAHDALACGEQRSI